MNTGIYTLRGFLTDQNLDQILIPEIQRDYVWTSENVKTLLNSLNDDASKRQQVDNEVLESLPPEVKELTLKGLKDERKATNIGFIYAYSDPGYAHKYFLIDGQQRLTTIFLLLLALSTNNNKNAFKKSYFSKDCPKVDYKVREATQEFLRRFINAILNDRDMDDIRNSYWYFAEYESDITIQAILRNYTVIKQFISNDNCALDFDYIENNVEFWYFDTDKSQQGEELYIYMNSRGETVQPNEQIKAGLLEPLPDVEKDKWGKEWEEWQDFFWKRKSSDENSNADKGFNEFLRWVKIINYITTMSSATVKEQEEYIKTLRTSRRIDGELLSLSDIKEYFESLLHIYKEKNDYFQDKWLYGETDLADYIRLLPVLMFSKKHRDAKKKEMERFSRFFYNLPRFAYVRRNPDTYCVHSVHLTDEFLGDNLRDVVDLINYQSKSDYVNILTEEEKLKLKLYKKPPNGVLREDLERELWKAEDYTLNYGRIGFLFYCIGFNDSQDTNSFSFERFTELRNRLVELFGKSFAPDDLLRRALLTKGDYSLLDGSTPKLGGQRWTFVYTIEKWRNLCRNNERMNYLKELLLQYTYKRLLQRERAGVLADIISEYSPSSDEESFWIKLFITEPKILEYCKKKNICWVNEPSQEIYLLNETKATEGSYINLHDFLIGIGVSP
jgi:uncharacterized protein with ParB-like and HNH nuclease domain